MSKLPALRHQDRTMLIVQLLIGLILAGVTLVVLSYMRDASGNALLGWLSWSGVGVGLSASLLGLLVIVLTADFVDALFCAMDTPQENAPRQA